MSLTNLHAKAALLPLGMAAALVLSACGSNSSGSSDNADASEYSINLDDCLDPAAATEEITDTFTIGYSVPLSGPVAGPVELASAGYMGRVDAENAEGGIDGVKIEVIYKDDGFAPDKAKANGTEFLESIGVDAINTFGSGPLGALADDQNAHCVPMLYASSSAPEFSVVEDYPWTTQYLPSANAEARFLVSLIQSKYPDGVKLGVAENESASGQANVAAFEAAAEEAGLEIALTTPDTDPNAAATALKADDIEAVFHAGIVGTCGQLSTAMGRIGYEPEFFVSSSSCIDAQEYIAAGEAADGAMVPAYLKNPASPELADDEGMKTYLEQVADAPNPENSVTVSGWLMADLMINTLKQASASPDGLTRLSIIEAARDQRYSAPVLLEGIEWVGTTEHMGIDAFQPLAWDAAKQRFLPAGDAIATS